MIILRQVKLSSPVITSPLQPNLTRDPLGPLSLFLCLSLSPSPSYTHRFTRTTPRFPPPPVGPFPPLYRPLVLPGNIPTRPHTLPTPSSPQPTREFFCPLFLSHCGSPSAPPPMTAPTVQSQTHATPHHYGRLPPPPPQEAAPVTITDSLSLSLSLSQTTGGGDGRRGWAL